MSYSQRVRGVRSPCAKVAISSDRITFTPEAYDVSVGFSATDCGVCCCL